MTGRIKCKTYIIEYSNPVLLLKKKKKNVLSVTVAIIIYYKKCLIKIYIEWKINYKFVFHCIVNILIGYFKHMGWWIWKTSNRRRRRDRNDDLSVFVQKYHFIHYCAESYAFIINIRKWNIQCFIDALG